MTKKREIVNGSRNTNNNVNSSVVATTANTIVTPTRLHSHTNANFPFCLSKYLYKFQWFIFPFGQLAFSWNADIACINIYLYIRHSFQLRRNVESGDKIWFFNGLIFILFWIRRMKIHVCITIHSIRLSLFILSKQMAQNECRTTIPRRKKRIIAGQCLSST